MKKQYLDLSGIPTPQLLAIRKVIEVGATAFAEDAQNRAQLCHKSPPAGYPKEKSEYGDPACYRYPLNTRARCLAAWRYVHHKDNWAILGDKAKTIEGKIKRYAKEHYNLDLQTGESEQFDWVQAFNEYYDGETMGERCDLIVLEPETSDGAKIDDAKASSLEADIKAKTAELESKSSQVEALTTEITDIKTELESLRKFKKDTEEAAEKAKKIQAVKSKLEDAGIEADVSAEADYWLGMSDDVLAKTIAKLSEMAKKQASASKEVKVPPVVSSTTDAKVVVAEGLREHKQERNKVKR